MSRRIRKQLIVDTVADWFDVSPSSITMRNNKPTVCKARSLASLILRDEVDLSFTEIADYLGQKDHSTVAASAYRLRHLMKTDDNLKEDYDTIVNHIKEVHTNDTNTRYAAAIRATTVNANDSVNYSAANAATC
jgi:chromosomal replication initiator protein